MHTVTGMYVHVFNRCGGYIGLTWVEIFKDIFICGYLGIFKIIMPVACQHIKGGQRTEISNLCCFEGNAVFLFLLSDLVCVVISQLCIDRDTLV